MESLWDSGTTAGAHRDDTLKLHESVNGFGTVQFVFEEMPLVNSHGKSYSLAMQAWLSDRITLDPAVCHGKPVVRGTRVLVANVVAAVASGQPFAEILQDYPALKEADIRACLEFASGLTAMESVEI